MYEFAAAISHFSSDVIDDTVYRLTLQSGEYYTHGKLFINGNKQICFNIYVIFQNI